MKKYFRNGCRRLLATCLAITVMFVSSISVSAITYKNSVHEPLSIYIDELSRINEELGTDYAIPVELYDEQELEETIKFFTEMSIEDFRNYIYEAHHKYISQISENEVRTTETIHKSDCVSELDSLPEEKLVLTVKSNENNETLFSASSYNETVYDIRSSYTLVRQNYYYDVSNNGNYLFFKPKILL